MSTTTDLIAVIHNNSYDTLMIVKDILDTNENVDLAEALEAACYIGNISVVEYLVDSGAHNLCDAMQIAIDNIDSLQGKYGTQHIECANYIKYILTCEYDEEEHFFGEYYSSS